MLRAPQLPLALPHAPSYGRDDFMPGPSNEVALRLIESWPAWPSPVLILAGPSGSGKTHLVHIWASTAGAKIMEPDTLAELIHPTVVAGGAIAIEDVAPDAVPGAALFHLINSVREAGGSLLVTSRAPADEWRVDLPDLRSRLRMAAPSALGASDDELLRIVLVKLFADRQIAVDESTIAYMLARMERSAAFARLIVEAVDRRSLQEGAGVTRGFVARILQETADSSRRRGDDINPP